MEVACLYASLTETLQDPFGSLQSVVETLIV